MAIYTFNNFGYEGSIVTVEVDLRRGIPAVDIIGLADSAVKETRERIIAAILNSGFEFPSERVLMSLSPADLKKEGAGFDLPMALSILHSYKESKGEVTHSQDNSVLVMGELELSGRIRPVRGVYSALQTAVSNGIKFAIIPKDSEKEPQGILCYRAENLEDAFNALMQVDCDDTEDYFQELVEGQKEDTSMKVEFYDYDFKNTFDTVEGQNGLKMAMAVAVAGHHNLMVWGSPGCGKTMMLQKLPLLMPKLLPDEQMSTNRIWSLAGLSKSGETLTGRPFRIPHQTASIEGICGGGISCRPGEISLAHNGVLFLDEAAEFRSSVLQMLRVPIETNSITLARAGRSTCFPAHFQLVMAVNPCPCGNLGNPDKVCLCSAKSVDLYWKKFSAPLLDRIGIRFDCNEKYYTPDQLVTLKKLREQIRQAWEVQYKRQGKLNQDLDIQETENLSITDFVKQNINLDKYTVRELANIIKITQTIIDMGQDDKNIALNQSIKLHGKLPIDFE